MNLVKVVKTHMQPVRVNGWEVLLNDVSQFCRKNEIIMSDMKDEYSKRMKKT